MPTANANASFGTVQQRYNDLIGNTTSSTADVIGQRHINSIVQDVLGDYPFSWNLKSGTITLSGGTATMPTDYYPGWQLEDCRIKQTGTGNDLIFTQILVTQQDLYDTSTPVYWITYASSTDSYQFNSNILTGTVSITYHYNAPTMVNTTDPCVIIDPELVAYGAAAKNWITDERNTQLAQIYQGIYSQGIKGLYEEDVANNAVLTQQGVTSLQTNWRQ